MQIGSVLSRFSDPAMLDRRKETIDGILEASPTPAATALGQEDAAVREILQDYDVTDISPRQFSEMLQKLRQAGALSSEQFQQLSAMRVDLDAEGVEPDESIDLMDYYSRRLEKLQRDLAEGDGDGANRYEADAVHQWVAWLEKFATARTMPDDLGWNAVA